MTRRLGYLLSALIACIVAAACTWIAFRNVADLHTSNDLGALGYLDGTITWGIVSTVVWILAVALLAVGIVARNGRKDG